jgi:5'-deoxynucleotidase YfbR-like HD superfamily hydrolase
MSNPQDEFMDRIIVYLTQAELQELHDIAERQLRAPREQARYFILRGMGRLKEIESYIVSNKTPLALTAKQLDDLETCVRCAAGEGVAGEDGEMETIQYLRSFLAGN